MSFLIKKIFQNHSTRILTLLFIVLLFLIAYFLGHSYYVQLDIHKSRIKSTLEAVSSTAAAQLDANQLEYLLSHYKSKDDIKSNEQDGVYELLHKKLKKIKELNSLSTEIYTLTFDSDEDQFVFGVSTSDQPFYRHSYSNFPSELKEYYHTGTTIDVYEDDNGHWISAFTPIKNQLGKTIAVVQVDQRFDEFINSVRKEIFKNIGISAVVTLLILFFLIRSLRSILHKEDLLNANLLQSKLELEQKNKDTLDSIIYAKKIQDAMLPLKKNIKKVLPNSFIFYLPRDIVSGDFYWFKHTRNKIFIAAVDCTGHGVPGALMSMIGSVLLDDVINKKKIDEPNLILNELHSGVVRSLKQSHISKASRDGMDIALCVIEDDFSQLSFSGAFRPLNIVRNEEVIIFKSTSDSIGGFKDEAVKYDKHNISLQKGDTVYLYSDGFPDQFGGENEKKYMSKRFRDLLVKVSNHSIDSQAGLLQEELDAWKGGLEQVDDILVIGFRV